MAKYLTKNEGEIPAVRIIKDEKKKKKLILEENSM